MVEELLDLYGASNSMHNQASFMHGFKMGALMMIEVYSSKEELV
jgi:hypothetical protein